MTEQPEHRELVMGIEVIGRLVQKIRPHLLRQQRRHRDPPLLTARERIGAPRGELTHFHLGEGGARDALILGALPLPQRQVRMAADQHRLHHRGDEGILQVLRQKTEALRHGAARQAWQRRLPEQHLACGRGPQACKRVQRQGLARAVAPEDRHQFPGCELDRQGAHQFARACAHTDIARTQGRSDGAHGCVHRISSAVAGPTTTCVRLRGICHSLGDSGRRPAMISVSACG
jgi:hypothetical protein